MTTATRKPMDPRPFRNLAYHPCQHCKDRCKYISLTAKACGRFIHTFPLTWPSDNIRIPASTAGITIVNNDYNGGPSE